MSDAAITPAPGRMPIPMGVIAGTGETRPELTEEILQRFGPDADVVLKRKERGSVLAVDATVDDATDLTQTGWGVLFASDADPAIEEALKPLIEWRQSQVGSEKLCKVFRGNKGVMPKQTAGSWAFAKGVTLVAPVSPRKGVPYYLMVVGSPERIPFEFQAQLDLQWAMGRLHFDNVEDYAAYAQHVVNYEKGLAPAQKREAAVWIPRNRLDIATAMLAGTIGLDFQGQMDDVKLGARQKFELKSYIGDGTGSAGAATKARLSSILEADAPAVLFTGSHGAEFPIADPATQHLRQGALVTQEWTRGNPIDESNHFAGSDLSSNAKVHGMMAFLFACFGGGCPDKDTYYFENGAPIPLTPEPLIGALPKALLSRGALAVIAHVDRAFSYGFEDAMGTPQSQLLRSPLEDLMKGKPVGLASDYLNLQWSSYASILGMALGGLLPQNPTPPSSLLANLYIARDDARNYIVLGDPAARLRVAAMEVAGSGA